jgi:iron complex outermembrane receptor protein
MNPFRLAALCLMPAAALAQERTLSTINVGADALLDRREAATQKVVIGTKEIENMGALTIGDVISKLPGVDSGSDVSMGVRARGMVRDSVQIMIDGERVAGNARMAQAIIGRLPSDELAQVEIMRGASAEFGSSAPMTINLVLKRARPKESTSLKTSVALRNSEPNGQFSYSQGGGDKDFSWLLPISILRNGHATPADQSPVRQDSTGTNQSDEFHGRPTTKELNFAPRFTWNAGNDHLTVAPNIYRSFGHRTNELSRSDLATPANGGNRHDDETSRTEFNRLRMDAETNRGGIKYSGRLSASTSDYYANMQRDFVSFGGVTTPSRDQTNRHERDLGGTLRVDAPLGQHLLAAAIERSGHNRDETLQSTVGNEAHTGWDRQWTAWLQDEWTQSPGVTLTPGLRGEFIRYAADGAAQSHQRWLPSLALRYEPAQNWVARTSLGAGIKAPKLEEVLSQPVYSVGSNTPLEPDKRGNPSLAPERSLNFEAVIERYLPDEMGVAGINLFVRHTEDFIERRVQLEGARWVERPYNEGPARHWGLELDGKLRTDFLGWRGATFRTHLTLPRSRVSDRRLGIERAARETPRYQWSGGYDQTLGEWSYGASFQRYGQVKTDVPGEQQFVTRQRTLVDAYVMRRLTSAFNLRLSGQNLFKADTRRFQNAMSTGSDWRLATTDHGVRTVMLSLEGKW